MNCSIEQEIETLEQLISNLLVKEAKLTAQNDSLRKKAGEDECMDKMYRLACQKIERGKAEKIRQIAEKHLKTMRFIDAKISNHQKTLQKYQALYRDIQRQKKAQDSLWGDFEQDSISCSSSTQHDQLRSSKQYEKQQYEKQQYDKQQYDKYMTPDVSVILNQSGLTSKSKSRYRPQSLSQITVKSALEDDIIYEINCKICQVTYKPNSYYRHLQSCQQNRSPLEELNRSQRKTSRRGFEEKKGRFEDKCAAESSCGSELSYFQ